MLKVFQNLASTSKQELIPRILLPALGFGMGRESACANDVGKYGKLDAWFEWMG